MPISNSAVHRMMTATSRKSQITHRVPDTPEYRCACRPITNTSGKAVSAQLLQFYHRKPADVTVDTSKVKVTAGCWWRVQELRPGRRLETIDALHYSQLTFAMRSAIIFRGRQLSHTAVEYQIGQRPFSLCEPTLCNTLLSSYTSTKCFRH